MGNCSSELASPPLYRSGDNVVGYNGYQYKIISWKTCKYEHSHNLVYQYQTTGGPGIIIARAWQPIATSLYECDIKYRC